MKSTFSFDDNYIYVALPYQLVEISLVQGFKLVFSCPLDRIGIPGEHIK